MAKNNVDFLPIKKPNQDKPLTPAEVIEWKRCKADAKYFMKTYCMIMSPGVGACLFDLRDYQIDMVDTIESTRKVIVNAPRQSGKTQTLGGWLLHRAIFFKNETIVVGSYRVSATKEIMDRIRYSMESLPDFLKPPVEVYNKFEIRFTNKSSIIGQVVTSNFARGKSPTVVYVDEASYIDEDVITEAYNSFSPALDAAGSASTSKLIITSTPDGTVGWFYRQVSGAIAKLSEFIYHKVDHTKIPNRDENFRKEKIRELGLAKYLTEYEGAFVSSKQILIDSILLESIQPKEPVKVIEDLELFTTDFTNKRFHFESDIGLVVGGDVSMIQIVVIGEQFIQVGEYASNFKNQTEFFKDINKTVKMLKDAGAAEIYLTFESNSIGQGISRLIESASQSHVQDVTIISDVDKYGSSTGRLGLTTTTKSKAKGLADLKDLVESNRLVLNSAKLLNELKVFEKQKNSTFRAASGYFDDRVMGMCLICNMLEQIANYEDDVHESYNKVDYIDENDEVWGIF